MESVLIFVIQILGLIIMNITRIFTLILVTFAE